MLSPRAASSPSLHALAPRRPDAPAPAPRRLLRPRGPSLLKFAAAVFAAIIASVALTPAAPALTAAWRQEIYVWQRQWTPAVNAALATVDADADAVHLLAAEIVWRRGQPEIFRARPDYPALVKLRAPVGLVLRVGPYRGKFSAADETAALLVSTATELLRDARANGIEPLELQIDFDCAEASLAGYRDWLRALRAAAGNTPLAFTALPAWLRHPDAFAALAHAADSFVLQVHSLEKPRDIATPLTLCDPARARRWADQAARAGKPFRIALPTYGYEVAFDAAGKFVALAAEGPRREWAPGTQVREVRTDEAELAKLAASLRETPPAGCAGVIWFRLPVDGDRLNWSVRTLAAILRREPLRARLAASVAWNPTTPGLAELVVENTGNLDQPRPARVEVTWPPESRILSADALAGYACALKPGAARASFALSSATTPPAVVPPGGRVRVGWISFSHETPLHLEIPASLPSR